MKQKIVVVGSSNTDMVIKSAKLPIPGETVIGGTFWMGAGGKGANQAVAAARLGGRVSFISKVGMDIFGDQALENFQRDKIDISGIGRDKTAASGVALIMVDSEGENIISVAPGANFSLSPEDVEKHANLFADAGVVLLQLEIPLETVKTAAHLGAKHGAEVILNPAPAYSLESKLLKNISILTPNRNEAQLLTGTPIVNEATAQKAARELQRQGVKNVIITLGKMGAMLATPDDIKFMPAYPVKAVDATGAGDAFNGAIAAAMMQGMPLPDAIRFANAVSALTVSQPGAQSALPYLDQVYQFLQRQNDKKSDNTPQR